MSRLLAAAFVVAAAIPARADTVVVLPTTTEPGAPTGTTEKLRASLTEVVGAAGDIAASPPTGSPACTENECAAKLAASLRARVAVRAKAFHSVTDSVALIAVTPQGDRYIAEEELDGDPRQSLQRAWLELQQQFERGTGPFLLVKGAPMGASIALDGRVVGALPLERLRVAPGMHLLLVSHPGHETLNRTITVDEPAGTLVEIEVSLPAGAVPPRLDSQAQDPPHISSRAWLLTGASMVVGGAALSIPALIGLSRSGECRRCDSAHPEQAALAPSAAAVRTAAAAGLIAGALGVAALTKGLLVLRYERMTVGTTGRGLLLQGTF
jgi:PEGA domain